MRAYVISQLDPFHDSDYKLTGAPSSLNTSSVISMINSEQVFTAADFGLPTGAGDKWDMNIASFPTSNSTLLYLCNQPQPGLLSNRSIKGLATAADFSLRLYPLNIHGVNSGDETYVANPAAVPAPFWTGIAADPLGYTNSNGFPCTRRARLVAQAFEVVDETPKIYQQGTVTVYKQPSTSDERKYACDLAVDHLDHRFEGLQTANSLAAPPTNQLKASRLASSRTWSASKGAYVISEKTVEEVPFKFPDHLDVVLDGESTSDTNTTEFRSYWPNTWRFEGQNTTTKDIITPTDASFHETALAIFPFNVSGAYFTGLSSQYGSFRIRFRQFFEIIPTTDDLTLVPLATPTLPRNQEIEKLIQEIVAKQPAGYMQTDNPRGEVWRRVIGTMGKVLETAAPALGTIVPGLNLALQGGGKTLQAISKINEKKKTNKKKKKNTPVPNARSPPKVQSK